MESITRNRENALLRYYKLKQNKICPRCGTKTHDKNVYCNKCQDLINEHNKNKVKQDKENKLKKYMEIRRKSIEKII